MTPHRSSPPLSALSLGDVDALGARLQHRLSDPRAQIACEPIQTHSGLHLNTGLR